MPRLNAKLLASAFLGAAIVFSSVVVPVSELALAKGGGSVYVHGYTKSNGTYVAPHYRSAPDGNPYNNWSFPGNTNPYTGKTATGDPATYLRDYYNRGGSADAYSLPSYSDPSATSASDPSGGSTSSTTRCGAHGHEFDHGCTCDAGYANHFGTCVFASCPAGSRQNAKGECETKSSTLDPTQRVNCLSRNPCVCPAGFESLANRTCVPK